MNRIKETFEELGRKGEKPFIVYSTACDPNCKDSLKAFKLILKYADIVEVGMPFSDPLADGPTIQKAHERALFAGADTEKVLELVSNLRKEFPKKAIILMGYYNPMYAYGMKKFIEDAKKAGADGFIVPDLPPEEGKNFSKTAKSKGLSPIFLAAPTSNSERLKKIGRSSGDLIYYVSVTGITGEREDLAYEKIGSDIRKIKDITNKKVVVGFGISRPEHIKRMYNLADGFVVGSAVVKYVGRSDFKNLEILLKKLKEATREAECLE